MHLLLTNDDGILAPGLEALYRAVTDLGHVDVVAPDDSQSGVGHAISVLKPLLVRRLHVNNLFHGWSVAGRPADCVKLAMNDLLAERPDLVLSGINAGANTGINVLYSGTIAGAVEAALFGVPAIAFSLELSDELDFAMAGRVARRILDAILAAQPVPGTCLAGLLVDAVIYTLLFFVVAKGWKMLVPKRDAKGCAAACRDGSPPGPRPAP